MRGGSNLAGLAPFMFRERFRSELIELPGSHILLELTIPSLPIVLGEPRAERREFLRTQVLDFTFDDFELRHANRYLN